MKKDDVLFIENELRNDYLLRDYLKIIKINAHNIKIVFRNKLITIFDNCGFAYLISWFCDGSITASESQHLNTICNKYNDRF